PDEYANPTEEQKRKEVDLGNDVIAYINETRVYFSYDAQGIQVTLCDQLTHRIEMILRCLDARSRHRLPPERRVVELIMLSGHTRFIAQCPPPLMKAIPDVQNESGLLETVVRILSRLSELPTPEFLRHRSSREVEDYMTL